MSQTVRGAQNNQWIEITLNRPVRRTASQMRCSRRCVLPWLKLAGTNRDPTRR